MLVAVVYQSVMYWRDATQCNYSHVGQESRWEEEKRPVLKLAAF